MVSHLVYCRINMSFGVVGTAKTEVDDPLKIFLAVPAAQLRFYLLTLVWPQIKFFESCQDLSGNGNTLATSI